MHLTLQRVHIAFHVGAFWSRVSRVCAGIALTKKVLVVSLSNIPYGKNSAITLRISPFFLIKLRYERNEVKFLK